MSDESSSDSAIDMRAIIELAEGDDQAEEFIAEITAVFLADLSKRTSAIVAQMSAKDYAGVRATAHAIKGSCGHFGAARLVELSGAAEKCAGSANPAGLQDSIDSMLAETERVRAAVEAFRAGKAQA